MKTVTIQVDGKLEDLQIPRGNFIFIADKQGTRTGRIDKAIGAICHNQNCGKEIVAGDWVYSKCTAQLHRSYYHILCARQLNLLREAVK